MSDATLRHRARRLDPGDDAALIAWLHEQRRVAGPEGAISALEDELGAEEAMRVRVRLWLPRESEVLCGRGPGRRPRPWHVVTAFGRGPESICSASAWLPESTGWRWKEPWSYGTRPPWGPDDGAWPWTCALCGQAWRRRIEGEARRLAGIHPRTPRRSAQWTSEQEVEARWLARDRLLAELEEHLGRRPLFARPQ